MDTPVWDKPDPTKSEKHLSQKKENRARARAARAGRPYPNLIDNMAVSKDDQVSFKISGKLHRIYEEKNGDIVVNHAGSKKQNGKYDKINLSDMAGVKSVNGGVKATTNWHKEHPHTDVKKFDTPAWTRSAGKNPEGGLNAKGRASAKAEGHNLKPPVKSGNNPRRASFLARMSGNPGPEHKPNGEPTRLLLSLQKWGASSKEDAKRKAAAMSKSWEIVSKVFPQPAILREGSRRTRVMVTHVHAAGKPHLGIIHPERGQEVTHRDNLTFVKNKVSKPKVVKPAQPKPVQLDLFGEPLRKSMEYDVPMSQSRFGGASSVGYSFEEIEKAKKRQKPSLNPQQKIFRDLARMEAEHGEALANGHSTAPRKVAAIARGHQSPGGIDGHLAEMNRDYLKRKRLVRGAKVAGVTALGAGLIGATAYGLHRRNRLSDVTKASPGAGRVLEGASDAVRGSRQSGARTSRTSGQILGDIGRDAAKEAKRAKLYGPRPGAPLSEIAPARARTRVAMPGGQGGTHARITSHDEIAEMMRQQSMKGKELVLRPKAGLPVDTRPVVPKVKKPGTDLVRVGSPASTAGATRTTGSSLVPVRSAPPVQAPNYGREMNYMPHAAAAAAIGSYGGYKVSKRLSEINKAYDEYGNPVKSGMASGSGSTALGLAGAGTAAYGVRTMRNAGALPRTAPIAEKVAEAANNKAIANSAAARNTVALNQAKLTSAKATRPMFNGSRAAKRTLIESQRQAHMVDRQAQKTAGKLVGTQSALKDIPGAMKASRNFGAAAVLGGTALAAGVLHNKTRGGN